MRTNFVALTTGVLAIVGLCVLPAVATETFQGQVLSAANGRIVIQETADRTWAFQVAADATIRRDGKPVRLEDLKTTDTAAVTTDNRMTATLIEAKSGRIQAVRSIFALTVD